MVNKDYWEVDTKISECRDMTESMMPAFVKCRTKMFQNRFESEVILKSVECFKYSDDKRKTFIQNFLEWADKKQNELSDLLKRENTRLYLSVREREMEIAKNGLYPSDFPEGYKIYEFRLALCLKNNLRDRVQTEANARIVCIWEMQSLLEEAVDAVKNGREFMDRTEAYYHIRYIDNEYQKMQSLWRQVSSMLKKQYALEREIRTMIEKLKISETGEV